MFKRVINFIGGGDPRLSRLIIASLVLNGTLWIVALVILPLDRPATVLHYNLNQGVDFIGEGRQIITLPLVGLAIIICNGIISRLIRATDPSTTWVLWSIVPVIHIILLSAVILIKLANI